MILVTYPGAELLDITGPAAVFAAANRFAAKNAYDITVASPSGGTVAHSCGIELVTVAARSIVIGHQDIILVAGADATPLSAAMREPELSAILHSAARNAKRFGAICTGAFILGSAGLLTGKRVATHWAAASRFARLFNDVRCDADALYVVEDRLWTSAGVTAGIDMALAMVERDHGSAIKAAVARQLVVNSHRPGHQSQFSDLLVAQSKEDERFAGIVNWLQASTSVPITVEQMADHVSMAPRSFHRHFVKSFGQTPAKLFEKLRLNAARKLLEANAPIAEAARQSGFRSDSAFRTAFKTEFGITPRLYRESWHSSHQQV
ncbi:MAG: GlxA family transcriptional regulator [Sphingopyxis sp.]